jgi:FecR protein
MRCSAQFRVFVAALLLGGVLAPARAQNPEDLKRGVARISLIQGEVSIRRGDSGDWVAAANNAPLMTDDRISTGPNARAEVQFDAANTLRIGPGAEVRFTDLENRRFLMQLARGTVTFRVLRASDADAEVDTPSVSARPKQIGAYRISVTEDGQSEITVRSGNIEIFSPHGSEEVQAGQTMMARGNPSDPEFQIVAARNVDEWDRWNDSRDQLLARSNSYRYVPPGVYGTEDLDPYGRWTNVPPYGNVWAPAVGPGWAPYQCGRWVWEDWYGWTWVSCDPWGWAPYHYGRWFFAPGIGWAWYPGGLYVPAYWSPALVGFFGFGGGVGFGFGFANIGWVPLAPYELLHPWWGRAYYGSALYANRSINIVNVNVTSVYRNARIANAVSGVSAGDFGRGQFGNTMRVSGEQLRQAGMVNGRLPMAPTSANLRFSNRAAANIPRSNENARFFSHEQANSVQRVPFAEQQRSFQQARLTGPNRGPGASEPGGARGTESGAIGSWRRFNEPGPNASGVSRGAVDGSRATGQAQAQSARPPAADPQGSRNSGGWDRFGAPGGQQNVRGSGPQSNNGWDRFGSPANSSARPYAPGSNYRSQTPNYNQSQPQGRPQSLGLGAPVVRERSAAPRASGGAYGAEPRGPSGGGSASRGGGGRRGR